MSVTPVPPPPGPDTEAKNAPASNDRSQNAPDRYDPYRNRDSAKNSTDTAEQGSDRTNSEQKDGGTKRFGFVIGILVVLFAILLAIGLIPRLRSRKALTTQTQQANNALTQVDVVHPRVGPRVTTLTLPANIQAVAETDISARASGYVREWRVDIGDRVRAGQILAVLDTPDVDQQVRQAQAQVSQAQAQVIQQRAEAARALANLAQARQNAERQRQQLVQAQADLNLARVTAERYTYLVREGAVAQQSADQQVAAYNNNRANVAALQAAVQASVSDIAAYNAALTSARANVLAAEANLSASRANANRYRVLLGFKLVRAPFAGVVTSRSVDAGTMIGGSSSGGAQGNAGSPSGGGGSPAGGSNPASGTVASSGANSARGAMYSASSDQGAMGTNSATGASAAATTPGTAVSGAPGIGNATTAVEGLGGNAAASTAGVASVPRSPAGATAGSGNTPGSGGANSSSGGNNTPSGVSGAAAATAPVGSVGQDQGLGGTVVSPGTSLYHIARLDTVRIQVNVPQSFAPNVHVGDHTRISIQEFPNTHFAGRIARTASALDPQTRTLLTEIVIPNPGRRLLPGMYGEVVFNVVRPVAPLIIPDSALIVNASGTQVATVDRNGTVQRRPIALGRDFGREAEVLSGLTTGDLVIASPSDQLPDGVRVQPVLPDQKQKNAGNGQQQGQSQSTRAQNGGQGGQGNQGNQRSGNAGSTNNGTTQGSNPGNNRGANGGTSGPPGQNPGQTAAVSGRYGGGLSTRQEQQGQQ